MKTIALNEGTWEQLKQLREKEKLNNFNEVVEILIRKSHRVPNSLFGVDKGKSYILKEHKEFQRDAHE